MAIEANFMVGGEAGQGVQSVGFLLGKVFSRGGYHVLADQDYESRIRGGHNFFRVRVKDSRVTGIAETIDVLIALNKESIDLHQKELTPNGVIILEQEGTEGITDSHLFRIPLTRLAQEKAEDKVMANTVALGAALALVGYQFDILDRALRDFFGDALGEGNVKAARAGYDYAQEHFKGNLNLHISPMNTAPKRMFLTGNEAISLGAMAAGCKFVAGYPMTPTTPILEYLAGKAKDYGLVVVQPEDEIAAINMTIGAGYAGVRAMTATSGGGFCLMVEGLGLAGMTETPIVIIEGQRPGPAIGLPTRQEQGDLEFILYASHGEFPRALLAPASVEDCFWLTIKAFNLAEKYQTPVIVITDHHLATSYATAEPFDISKVVIDRGLLFSKEPAGSSEYRRHLVTKSGISPRAFPGEEGVLVVTDSDEHDEAGHLIEDARTRIEQMQKRMRKEFSLKNEITPPQLYGPQKADMMLIGWGSTGGAIREAVDLLRQEKVSVNHLHFTELWPFPSEAVTDAMSHAHDIYVVDNNATGQLAHLIRAETGRKATGKILKYDGRPITPAYIVDKIKSGRCD